MAQDTDGETSVGDRIDPSKGGMTDQSPSADTENARPDRSRSFRLVILGLSAAQIAVLNWLLPWPDINDFKGIAYICNLMDESLSYCVNPNWGFMHPLSHYVLTLVTRDLLVSQRMLSALFVVATLLLADEVMKRRLSATQPWMRATVLLLMLVSPWMCRATISAHLDIAGVAFLLGAFLLADGERARAYVAAGCVCALGYWFRFHFLGFAVLFPLVVAAFHWKGDPCKKALWALAGVALGVVVPHVLSYAVFGSPSISNLKLILAMNLAQIGRWTLDYPPELAGSSLGEIIAQISWGATFRSFGEELLKLWAFWPLAAALAASTIVDVRRARRALPAVTPVDYRATVLVLYAIVCVLPFIYLRQTFNWRLQLVLVLPCFPALVCILKRRGMLGLVLAALFVAMTLHGSVRHTRELTYLRATRSGIAREVLASVPVEVLRDRPSRVLCRVNFYNPYHKYRMCSDVILGGWLGFFPPYVEKSGAIDLLRARETGALAPFEYLLLPPSGPGYYPELLSTLPVLNRNDPEFAVIIALHASPDF